MQKTYLYASKGFHILHTSHSERFKLTNNGDSSSRTKVGGTKHELAWQHSRVACFAVGLHAMFFFFDENYGNPGVTLINFYAMWVWEI